MVEAQLEKMWQERVKEFKEKDKALPKWDPEHPKNKETYEPGARTYDVNDEDDIDLLDAFIKPIGFDSAVVEESTPSAVSKPAPPAQQETEIEDEDEYEDEDEDEEE